MGWLRVMQQREPFAPDESLTELWAEAVRRWPGASPFDLAVFAARAVPLPGLAFAMGYQAALRVLWPSAPAGLGAICVTENRSIRPADLATKVQGTRLSGRKDFVTAGDQAEWLMVAARCESLGQPPRLSMTVVYPGEPGVRLEALPPAPIMPETGHARAWFEHALCALLPGDGWDDYVKPFRSVEDLYILAALVSWLLGIAIEDPWPQTLQLRLLAVLGGCAEAARQPPLAPATHLLLAGLFAQFEALAPEVEHAFDISPRALGPVWRRDRALFELARGAREKRLACALAVLG